MMSIIIAMIYSVFIISPVSAVAIAINISDLASGTADVTATTLLLILGALESK
ncbi:hypothetical protein [Macrococcus animalis]|uniref:hypothetical protein n=1 Tax=Macrococcus animalis TaxID=3395467 RepID=UPI0039BE60CE